jgi:CBS domain containing-hemolysin-like protein
MEAFLSNLHYFVNEVKNFNLIPFIPLIICNLVFVFANGIMIAVDIAINTISMNSVNNLEDEESIKLITNFIEKKDSIIPSLVILAEIIPFVGGSATNSATHALNLGHSTNLVIEIISILLLLQTSVIFKYLGINNSVQITELAIKPMLKIAYVFSPIASVLEHNAKAIVGELSSEQIIDERSILRDVEFANLNNIIDGLEKSFVINAIAFSEKTVGEVMTPINKATVIYIDKEYSKKELIDLFHQCHSRIPVVSNESFIPTFHGYILAKEFLLALYSEEIVDTITLVELIAKVESNSSNINSLKIHDAPVVYENDSNKILWEKFTHAKKKEVKPQCRNSLALVYYKEIICGIVTISDLLQEVVGDELNDEDDVI